MEIILDPDMPHGDILFVPPNTKVTLETAKKILDEYFPKPSTGLFQIVENYEGAFNAKILEEKEFILGQKHESKLTEITEPPGFKFDSPTETGWVKDNAALTIKYKLPFKLTLQFAKDKPFEIDDCITVVFSLQLLYSKLRESSTSEFLEWLERILKEHIELAFIEFYDKTMAAVREQVELNMAEDLGKFLFKFGVNLKEGV